MDDNLKRTPASKMSIIIYSFFHYMQIFPIRVDKCKMFVKPWFSYVWQFLCDEFYLLVYMTAFARILCGKYICRKTSLPVFMWQTKIVNYENLFVYNMTRHIFVACIYLHVCQALCDYNIALKTNFLRRVKKYLLYYLYEQSYLSGKIVKQKLFV